MQYYIHVALALLDSFGGRGKGEGGGGRVAKGDTTRGVWETLLDGNVTSPG